MNNAKNLKGCALVALLFALGGCSISAPVYSISRINGEVLTFEGVAVGYMDRTGTIDMTSTEGTKCAGEFHYTGRKTGVGRLTCSNGEEAEIQFTGITNVSGYGYGVSSSGFPIAFTFGLNESERKQYLRLDKGFASKSNQSQSKTSKGGTGSGFSIGNSLFLTNAHVVSGCETVTIGHTQFGVTQGDVLASDSSNDLAAILVNNWSGQSLNVNSDRAIRIGERVATYGYPFGGAIASSGTLATGDVNALAGLNDDSRFLQISVPVQPGNSGGPLVNVRGELVGIVTGKLNAIKIANITGDIPQNVNFALKATTFDLFLDTNKLSKPESHANAVSQMPDIAELLSQSTAKITCKP